MVITVAYMDYANYASFINNTQNQFLLFTKDLGLHRLSKLKYRKRLELLLPYFDVSSCIPSVNILNVECSITKVIQDYLRFEQVPYKPSHVRITLIVRQKKNNKKIPTQ